MKKIIITGCPRTGSTALVYLLNQPQDVLITNELGTFHYSDKAFNMAIKNKFMISEAIRSAGDKNWNINDVINLRNGLINTKFKFMGDKRPDYCSSFTNMESLIKNHQDAYFIFTYRNPCATAWSFIKRTTLEPKHKKVGWYALDFETAANTIVHRTNNWLSTLYPNVKHKLIVNYDDYIDKPANLVQVLENFLQYSLEIKQPELTYTNENSCEYKIKMDKRQQNLVKYKFSILKEKIDSLI